MTGVYHHIAPVWAKLRLTPISDEFTYERFEQLLEDYEEKDKKSINQLTLSPNHLTGGIICWKGGDVTMTKEP